MKKLLALTLLIALLLPAFATETEEKPAETAATPQPALSLLYNNPLPEIFEKVSPSVAVLAQVSYTWDKATDSVNKQEKGSGSAVYIKEGGYFLTNHHVIEDADELEIRLSDGRVLEAELVGSDAAADVAVVKVNEELELTPVKIGKSSDLKVGEIVLVIGTPISWEMMYNTLTTGIVSGLNRDEADYEATRAIGLIQIDAAVNPGNSGGALLNLDGEIVGIPFMKYMGYYYKDANNEDFVVYEGLSFAVPMDVAWPIAESIIATGSYKRPRFGVSVTDNEGPEEPLKNYPPAGLLIGEVEKNGSGFKAGLRSGDVITHVNGIRVKTFREYTKIVDKLGAGESFTISVVRYKDKDGNDLKKFEKLELTVTLEMID
ncbi:MAG: trypsin-like peptidase domain-containing protein [Clostridia bacterium]|nr:trypsin-like peptidase domain-containing protein [Clostridia bacterium]MCR4577952.1 trypsin-like peptidase domain-containing protein [Clostridiales bacterium]